MSRSRFVVSLLTGAALAAATMSPAAAGGFYTGSVPAMSVGGGAIGSLGGGASVNGEWGGGGGGGGGCHGHGPSIININKNINLNKNININKIVIINKVNVQVAALAEAIAEANAHSSAGAQVIMYGGGSYEYVNVNQSGNLGAVAVAGGHCEMQEATVVKSVHAVCVTDEGREFPASHMVPQTWIESGYEGEIARCIAGSHIKITIGDVVQSDQGMAGTFSRGIILQCGEGEAVRHFKDGMLKCTPAMAVPDCTERTNLRKYGTGDMFFSYRSRVCADTVKSAERDVDLDGNQLGGGVGTQGTY